MFYSCVNNTCMLYIQHKAFLYDSCMEDISNCHTWFSLHEIEHHRYLMWHCLLVQRLCPCKHNLYSCYEISVPSSGTPYILPSTHNSMHVCLKVMHILFFTLLKMFKYYTIKTNNVCQNNDLITCHSNNKQ